MSVWRVKMGCTPINQSCILVKHFGIIYTQLNCNISYLIPFIYIHNKQDWNIYTILFF